VKVAIIGSAPSSIQHAPYNDPAWRIWACSPGAFPLCKRIDLWFEIHRWEPPGGYSGAKPWFTPEYVNGMAALKCPVLMIDRVPEIPTSVAYPKDAILEEFGPYAFSSTPAWMVALAVVSGAKEIGLWGIDMSAREEWVAQRTGLQNLLWLISDKNKRSPYKIKITIPPESDIWVPPVLYGFCEANPHFIKLLTKKFEFAQRYNNARAQLENAQREVTFFEGAADHNDYEIQTWCQDPKARELVFSKPTWATVPLAPDPVIEELVNEGLPPVSKANGHAEAVAG
jgi:hypothetical protein